MSVKLNYGMAVVNEKLEQLWKQYSDLFNDYNPVLDEIQRKKMDFLLQEIRTLEREREKLSQSISI